MHVIYGMNISRHWSNSIKETKSCYSRCSQYIRTSLPLLALPYALHASIKLYTSIESLECQELAISCCRIFGGSSVDYYTHEFCGGQYEVVLYANGSVSVGNASIVVLMVITAYLHAGIPWQDVTSLLSMSPWISCLGRAFFFWNIFESRFSIS